MNVKISFDAKLSTSINYPQYCNVPYQDSEKENKVAPKVNKAG